MTDTTPTDVTRYSPTSEGDISGQVQDGMTTDKNGDFVTFDDFNRRVTDAELGAYVRSLIPRTDQDDPDNGKPLSAADFLDAICAAATEYAADHGEDDEISIANGATGQYDDDGLLVVRLATCGTFGLTWNDALISARTPVPAGRCPFEYDHEA
jgi:hypothetical protein